MSSEFLGTGNRTRRMAIPQPGVDGKYFHLRSEWKVQASLEEVGAVFLEPEKATVWWSGTYLRSEIIREADRSPGIGTVLRVIAKGWIPYTLQILFRVVDARYPDHFLLEACGDMNGTMESHSRERDGWCSIEFDWRIRADHAFIRNLATWLPPARHFLMSNHLFSMSLGEKSLAMEVQRRRGRTDMGHPPAAAFPHNFSWARNRIRWEPWTRSWEAAKAEKGSPG